MTYEYYVEADYVDEGYFTRLSLAATTSIEAQAQVTAQPRRTIQLSSQNLDYTWDSLPDDWEAWPRRLSASLGGRWEPEGIWLSWVSTLEAQAQSGVIVNLSAEFTQTALATRVLSAAAAITAQAQVSAQWVRIRRAAAVMAAQAEIQAQGQRSPGGLAELTALAQITALAQMQWAGQALLPTESALQAQGQVAINAEATLAAQALIQALARIITLDPDFTIGIPEETRREGILPELAEFRIQNETLISGILAERTALEIQPETRQELVI